MAGGQREGCPQRWELPSRHGDCRTDHIKPRTVETNLFRKEVANNYDGAGEAGTTVCPLERGLVWGWRAALPVVLGEEGTASVGGARAAQCPS